MTRRFIAAGFGLLALLPGCVASIAPRSSYRATVIVSFAADGSESVRATGIADPATRRRVAADDPVRIASISKLVTALGVMRLAEAGTLSLDRDVSDWLGWRLRNPAFPDAPVTLRMLLSHQSSLTDGADYVIPLGETLEQRLRDPRAWDTDHRPGSYFRYTNLNFPVVASVMEKATGERFDRLMTRLVFDPLKIDACMNWTGCSGAAIARAVAEWMTHRSSEIDFSGSEISRFYDHQKTKLHVRSRTAEGFNKTYGIVHPREQWATNRNVRVSPLFERQKALGAVFFEAMGFERRELPDRSKTIGGYVPNSKDIRDFIERNVTGEVASALLKLAGLSIQIGITGVILMVIYFTVPNARVRFLPAAVGALFAAVLWEMLKKLRGTADPKRDMPG